jgi:Ca-activated chloride channel family protein
LSLLRTWFAQPQALILLGLVPLLAGLALFARRRRRAALLRFASPPAVRTLSVRSTGWAWLRILCLGLGLVALITAIAGPRWGPDPDQPPAPGRDVIAVLDLSRSMLAQDVLPDRAGRAREALRDLSFAVQARGGHRLGLVAFAGRARLVCPLTHDYAHFRAALDDLDPSELPAELRAADPQTASGTRIGAGLRAAAQAHDPRFHGTQDILLLSDGDDPARDGEWREGVRAARALGIPVHVVGIGDPTAEHPIPLPNGHPLRFQGRVVGTRLDEEPLREIARLTGGTYTAARTGALPLGELFTEQIEPRTAHENVLDLLPTSRPRAAWFFGAALVFLGVPLLLGQPGLSRRGRKREVVEA